MKELIQKALVEIKSLRSQLNELKEPVAIIGIGCRFPGICYTPDDFWQLLSEGVDAISEVPGYRFPIDDYYDPDPDVPGKIYTRNGGFIGEVDCFDNDFFELTPREVLSLDPQQRVLMEVTWEALEHANINPDALYNSQTGVFIGMSSYDFMMKQAGSFYPKDIDAYFTLGNAHCVASGRIAYFLGLTGPCMTVDTACSSSLMAVHLACQSLRSKESQVAIAGGVNLILSPEVSINFSRAKMLSKDGRCKTFDNSADGYGRGEGCGIVVLKRLNDAIADKNNIIAVIRGSATNQDGPSGGITVPNGPAQQNVIKNAIENAGITADEISYIEAHGTGTSLGDPIEIRALSHVFKNHKQSNPLIVGSVKTNIVHLEAASGISGLIKAALSIYHQKIPKHLHIKSLNHYIKWQDIPLTIPTQTCDWPSGYEKRIAGVSSFGFSGSNVHIIIEEFSDDNNAQKSDITPEIVSSEKKNQYAIFSLSAKNESALNALRKKYATYLIRLKNNQHLDLEDLSYTSTVCRSHFQNRLSVIYEKMDDLIDHLQHHTTNKCVIFHNQTNTRPLLAWLFTGQGSQYAGMGKELYRQYHVYRDAVNTCCHHLQNEFPESILDVIGYSNTPEHPDLINNTIYTQTTLFILEYALARLWESWGVVPDIVMGHSIGEYVGACIAGVFSLEEGLKLVSNRAKLMQNLSKNGAMAAVFASKCNVQKYIYDYRYEKDISIAAVNGPESIVISGKDDSINEIIVRFKANNILARLLNVSHAFHSSLMMPMLSQFEQIANTIQFKAPQLKIVSNITGKIVTDEMSTASYWVDHIIKPVQFYPSIETIHKEQCHMFLEIGPKPILSGMGSRCLPDSKIKWMPSLTPDNPNLQLMKTLRGLYVNGVDIHWKNLFSKEYIPTINLPTYAFQRKKYWLKELDDQNKKMKSRTDQIHPFLKNKSKTSSDDIQFETAFNLLSASQSYISHHTILDHIIFPASGFIEMFIAAANEMSGEGSVLIEDVCFDNALFLNQEKKSTVLTTLSIRDDNTYQTEISSKSSNNQWLINAHCRLSKSFPQNKHITPALKDLRSNISSPINVSELYQKYQSQGLDYGPYFQALQQVWIHENDILGHIQLSKELLDQAQRVYIHPVILDACFQLIQSALPEKNVSYTYLPVNVKKMFFYNPLHDVSWGYARIQEIDQQKVVADLVLFDPTGTIAAEIFGFTAFCVNPRSWLMLQRKPLLYHIKWIPISMPDKNENQDANTENWLICSHTTDFANQLCAHLDLRSIPCSILDLNHIDEHNMASTLTGIVYYADIPNNSSRLSLQQKVQPLIHLVQVLGKMTWHVPPCLWIITKGAQSIEDISPGCNPFETALWGFGKSLALEFPELKCSMVDLDPLMSDDLSSLIQIFLSTDHESQIVLRDGKCFAPRLIKYDKPYENQQHVCLKTSGAGSLDHLYLDAFEHRKPGPSEIEIHVKASGLNFRDVLHALGMIEVEKDKNIPFGFECAGIVGRPGSDVTHIQPGQKVIAVLAPGSMSRIVNVRKEFVYPIPDSLSFEPAATVPLVFLTAWYGLCHLAKINENDTILIHAASGGVGLAAIQIARLKKAHIIATASHAKRQRLHEMGIQHVLNSRTLDFAEQIMNLTNNEGVDIVLNSLTGDFITKSLGVLKKEGRFIEIGKIGILTETEVVQIRPDIHYYPFDIGMVGNESPEMIQTIFHQMMPEFDQNNLSPLPYRAFQLDNIVSAFRYMAQARHFGKVVVSIQESSFQIHSHATYIITGGTGALGQILTKWLIQKGASCIVCISRHADTYHDLDQNKIVYKSCDVSCEKSMTLLFDEIHHTLPPVKGVIHAAGTLDDCSMIEQTWERFETPMKPKIWGAINLHQCTQKCSLDFFVMFSSSASLLGSAGQSNYAFANAFLDGFAQHRRFKGLCGTSINWGPWESGMAVSVSQINRNMTDKGISPVSADDAIASLEIILDKDLSLSGVIDIDWHIYEQTVEGQCEFIQTLYHERKKKSSQVPQQTLSDQLMQAQAEKREQMILSYLQKTGSKIAGYEDNQHMDVNKPLIDAGFDSLMAVEFRNILNQALNTSLPATLIFDYPTLQHVADYILDDVLKLQHENIDLSEKDVMDEIESLLK